MQIRKYLGLAVVPLFFALCPSLFAASYTWNFAGSGGTNCPKTSGGNSCADPGNSMTFKATTPGGPSVTATVTAWYVNATGTLQRATLGQYASGLGVCYQGENCSNSNPGNQEINNSGVDEFLLFQFNTPIDPNTITLDSPANGALDVSYWLGSTTNKSMNLANMNPTTSLSTLGFGSQTNTNAGSTSAINFGGAPSTSVNAVLFGAMYGYTGDFFDILGLSGAPVSTGTSGGSVGASVPEPASIFLLLTVMVAGWRIHRGQRVLHSRAQADPANRLL